MSSNEITVSIHDSHDSTKFVKQKIDPRSTNIQEILTFGGQKLNVNKPTDLYSDSGQELRNLQLLQEGDRLFISDGRYLNKNELFHLCMLGAGAVGKSALTLQFIQGQFIPDYDPTIEDAYRKQVSCDGNGALLDVLDTAGQEDFIALRTSWMRGRDGFVLVFAVDDHKTFTDLEQFYDQLCEVYEDNVPPFALVGNKSDLPEDRRQVTRQEAERCATEWNAIRYIETSAKTGFHVQDMFGGLVREIIGNHMYTEPPPRRWWCNIL